MAKQNIDIGVEGNDGTGDSIRESFRKVNENFQELYAVFGIGGQISFTDLSDTPNTYEGNENKVPFVKSDGSGMNFLELASNNALDGTTDTIGFDFSVDGKLILQQLVSRVANDPEPTLGGPLNAATQPIANVSVSQAAIDTFNSVHGTNLTTSALVIDKAFADRNYQEKSVAGGGLRLPDEPADVTQYTLTATDLSLGHMVVPNHGLIEAFNGAAFVFRTTGTAPFGVVNEGIYYVSIFDTDNISLYETEEDAINKTGRILLAGGTGTFTITDAAYDPTLPGNWLDNVAIPRKSAVRRQGDNMTGALNLFDHPGELKGTGLPNGPDDLQAATKLYVDNAASSSQVNLYVSTSGNDSQEFTPDGKEGRNPSYAYRTINAAARKAEELIIAADFEPGPYMQTMSFNDGESLALIATAGIESPIAGRNNARTLILANKEFIAKEVTSYINFTYPEFAGTYNEETCQRDIGYILESATLDALLGNNANYLSRWSGIRYYANVSAQKAIGSQRVETIAGIEYAKALVQDYILTNTAAPTYQTRVEQYIEPAIAPDIQADDAISAKFDIVLEIIANGVLDAPAVVDGTTTYKINIRNGNFGFIDQANPANTDIIPGKVVRGKNSGATARIIDYKYEAGPRAVSLPETDEIEVQLLKPIEFEPGEELEYGNLVRETQISIRVESGIYYEDYPIRVPANVSIKGDEFRRCIIRPKNRVSQSRWANTFFYRDAEFDSLVLGKSSIETINYEAQLDASRVPGTYTVSDFTTDKLGHSAIFEVTVDTFGSIANITVTDPGTSFQVGELIRIEDNILGDGGAAPVLFTITKVPNGIQYINPLTGSVDGYFGYHYLTQPAALKNTGPGYENIGNWETAALVLIDNREFIQEQVVNYIETTYPALIGVYGRVKCARDAGLIVDALVKDLRAGGNEFSLEAQGEYYAGAVEAGTEVETVAGINHIYTLASDLILGQEPTTLYGPGGDVPTSENLTYSADLFNGNADPDFWTTNVTYRLGNVVKFTAAGIDRYYTPTKEHVSGSVFNAGEIASFWREIDGPDTVIENLISTVVFAFNVEYNPPLRNTEMDVFLTNDATMIRNLTVQGHGGFMLVLDPEGQVLTKSPYIQTGSSFSQSANKQAFRGGMYVDAFVGNSAVQVIERVDGSPFRLRIQSLGSQAEPQGLFVRRPETPCAFYIDGRRFQVNAVSQYDPDFGTAELILSPNSNSGLGFSGITSTLATGVNLDTIGTFQFDEEKCARDAALILEAVSYDVAIGTNYNSVTAGLAYQRANAYTVQNDQKAETIAAIGVAKTEVAALDAMLADSAVLTRSDEGFDEVIDILTNGVVSTDTSADALVFPPPGVLPTPDADDAALRLQANRDFLAAEVVAYVDFNTPPAGYDDVKCARDVRYIVDALTYDILYGGNSATITNARAYFVGTTIDQLPTDQRTATAAAYAHLASVVNDLVIGTPVTPTAGNLLTPAVGGADATATEGTQLQDLLQIIENVVTDGTLNRLPQTINPDVSWAGGNYIAGHLAILTNTTRIVQVTVQSVNAPINITLQTAGNRSILGNDFTQVNDLGYGLVAVNGALSEMVSMFTYYCWASYYSKNGAEIRSLTGSSCYGEYGLIAEGSDPNEIPDAVELYEDMVQPAKTFTANVILTLTDPQIISAGEILTQAGSGAFGTVAVDTSQVGGSRTVYLTEIDGAFNQSGELTGSTLGALGAGSVPTDVDSTNYSNALQTLSVYVYDMKDVPSNRSEFDVYHPGRPAFARYEIANVEKIIPTVGSYLNVGTDITTTFVAGPTPTGTHAGAIFTVYKNITDGYTATIENGGTDYAVGDSIVVSGADLGGIDSTNDCTILIEAVDDGSGAITEITVSGVISVEATTPMFSNTVYKLNFSTSDAQYSTNGLLEAISFNVIVNYRRNQTHIISDLARPDVLTIRPSTALVWNENPTQVYRTISFLTSNSIGDELPANTSQAGMDESYDYIRLIVDSAAAQSTDLAGAGTTKGATAGDVRLAVQAIADDNEIFRLNNNLNTPAANRPDGWTTATLTPPPIMTWGGKKHYVFNYRGVSVLGVEVPPAEDNDYALVDLIDIDTINQTDATGIASTVVLGSELVTIRCGLQAGAVGDVTVNISTCRATGHDFLDIGTGGFNKTNYPNVIFGEPAEKKEANEVEERGKGRVFFVSTDQNGIFKVGRFFQVDQGTGTVTFSASIALSDVDGLGFKRGVVVTEFSTDTAMTDNASDTVPTEGAVRGYVNRRLGYDKNGVPVANKIGPGVLAPNGAVPMTDNLNAAGNTITNLKAPVTASDAATKAYVDEGSASAAELKDLRSLQYNDARYADGQLIIGTGLRKLIILSGSIVGGPFEAGQTITGTITGATGTIVDVQEGLFSIEGNITEIIYTPLTSVFSIEDVITVLGGAEGQVADGPIDEWANGVLSSSSDISVTTTRELTIVGSEITDRYTSINLQIKPNTIVNADVSGIAQIAQSKLNMNAATTRVDAVGIGQSDLGLASFDDTRFTITDGWVTVKSGSVPLTDIELIPADTVAGRSDTGIGTVSAVPFATVIENGLGLADGDFVSEISSVFDPGEALIKTSDGTYGISNVTKTGEVNSIVKTDANGSIQVNSLILGGNSSYEVLSLNTTELVFKTPSQGVILTAVGGTGGSTPTYPDLQIPGSVNIGSTGVTQSVLQGLSNFNNEKRLAVDWIYSSFMEAASEKGTASTGIALGADTGKTIAGEVGIVTGDSGTSSSVVPFIFSSAGARPDTDNTYDIGTATKKYKDIYATLFRGTATESYYADLAENYLADAEYAPGTVLVFGGDAELTVTTEKGTHRVAGVVSTNPAHLMNSHIEGENITALALQGRVPCNVVGRVAKGDMLVASAIPGYACVDNNAKAGTIIGKALSAKGDTERGTVEIVVGKH